jgi:uncharacterized membrane protein
MELLDRYIATAVIFLALDFLYLNFVAKGIFGPMIERIQKSPMRVNVYGAFIVYMLMTILHVNYVPMNVLHAFIIGMCVYGIFDFTNIAIFENYEILPSLMDTLWGGILFATTTFLLQKLF